MPITDPIAFFITWTTYGSWLPGDERGWRKRHKGPQLPQPLMARWYCRRLKHEPITLSVRQRQVVEQEVRRHCAHRTWHLWAVSARSNHTHTAATAPRESGAKVRDQLKANCTTALRRRWPHLRDRPIWSVGGDWKSIYTEDELHNVIDYIVTAQDRMENR